MCETWEKGADCGWNQRTARILLLPFLVLLLAASIYVLHRVRARNTGWTARPVLCLVAVSISQFCDILEHGLVLSEMRDHGHEWYNNSTVDAIGDVFLMYSLYLFAEIWCDNVLLLAHTADLNSPLLTRDATTVRRIYRVIAVATIPMVVLFSLGSATHHYDTFMILYVLWGVFTGLMLLTPAAILMHRAITILPAEMTEKANYRQLLYMARVNLGEQILWNVLIINTVVSIVLFLHGGNKSAALIGSASVSISICWILMHLQVVLFFATVTKAQGSSPIFDASLLDSLMNQNEDEGASAPARVHHHVQPSRADKIELQTVTQTVTQGQQQEQSGHATAGDERQLPDVALNSV